MSSTRPAVGLKVRDFYQQLPFNFYSSAQATLEYIRSNPVEATYPDLHRLLQSGQIETIIEVGCGAGWLSNSLALHYNVRVQAIDFTAKALERAREVSALLDLQERVSFTETNLFDFTTEQAADLVISLGVLHHTGDTEGAFHHIQTFAKPAGFVYVGLYHLHGRREFLRIFEELLESESEQAAFDHYCELDGVRQGDPLHMLSWFRDQVLHPHETQHTLQEIAGWCQADQLHIQSTSINGFGAIDQLEPLFDLEEQYTQRSHQANVVEKRYFPGFFVVLAQNARGC